MNARIRAIFLPIIAIAGITGIAISMNKPPAKSAMYDSGLAAELNADDYGMSKYVFAFLKSGPNRGQDAATADALQKGHLKNIQELQSKGKLVLAGPFLDDGDIRGIFIFDVESMEEAKMLIESDPAVQAGRLTAELHPWYGSAALKKLHETQQAISKKTF